MSLRSDPNDIVLMADSRVMAVPVWDTEAHELNLGTPTTQLLRRRVARASPATRHAIRISQALTLKRLCPSPAPPCSTPGHSPEWLLPYQMDDLFVRFTFHICADCFSLALGCTHVGSLIEGGPPYGQKAVNYSSNSPSRTPVVNVTHSPAVKTRTSPSGFLESRTATMPGRLRETSTQFACPLLRWLFFQTATEKSMSFILLAPLMPGEASLVRLLHRAQNPIYP